MPAAAPLLRASALVGQRGERRLFEELDLSLDGGEIVWLRGRNGRGKTTLLRLLAGLSSAAAGSVESDGSRLLYLAHANALKDDLTALEALAFLARLFALPGDGAALRGALKRLGIASRADAPVRTLSQGQRRRVALARLALARDRTVWLLDEPFDALDDEGIAALNLVITEHAARGGAVLLTSHQALTIQQPAPRAFDIDAFAPRRQQPGAGPARPAAPVSTAPARSP